MYRSGMSYTVQMASCDWKKLSCVLLYLSSAAACVFDKAPACYIHHERLPVSTSKYWHKVHHFNCSVNEGDTASAIVWRMDGKVVKQAPGPVSWLGLTLEDTVSWLTLEDTATLSCEAKMGECDVTCETTLADSDFVPPRITTRQVSYEVNIGEALVVPCRSTGFPQPILTWTKRDKSLHKSTMHPSIKWKQSRGSLDLVIRRASMMHSGIYKCHAVNRLGEDNHYAVVTVLYIPVSLPPRVVPLQPSLTVRKGSKAVLVCLVANTPRRYTALYWDHQGTRLNDTKRLQQKERFSVKIHKQMYKKEHAVMSLVIHHVTFKDAGVYTCGAVTHIGRGQQHVLLKVKE